MKKTITTLILLFGLLAVTEAQVNKNLVKSVSTEFSESAVVSLPGEAQLVKWDNDFVRITTNVELFNFGESILQRLVIVGRYEVKSDIKEKVLYITMPKASRFVSIKGVNLKEDLSFVVKVPKGYQVIYNDTSNEDQQSL